MCQELRAYRLRTEHNPLKRKMRVSRSASQISMISCRADDTSVDSYIMVVRSCRMCLHQLIGQQGLRRVFLVPVGQIRQNRLG